MPKEDHSPPTVNNVDEASGTVPPATTRRQSPRIKAAPSRSTTTNNTPTTLEKYTSTTDSKASSKFKGMKKKDLVPKVKPKTPRNKRVAASETKDQDDGIGDDQDNPSIHDTHKTRVTKNGTAPDDQSITQTSTKRTLPSPAGTSDDDDDKNDNVMNQNEDNSPSQLKKRKKAPAHQVLTECDPLPKLWNAADHQESYTMKIASWNVAGLRGLMKKDPDAIRNLIQRLDLDIFCLQETKLQEMHLVDENDKSKKVDLPHLPGYDVHYSCSTAKKGYSGTAAFVRNRSGTTTTTTTTKKAKQTTMDVFVKKATSAPVDQEGTSKATSAQVPLPVDAKLLIPMAVSKLMGVEKHDQEGRLIVMDFPLFTIANVYVPNSGMGLLRLDYRVNEWDKDFLDFMQAKRKERGVPVLWMGDLNIAHTNLEVWNDGAKHLPKQAGVTPQERASFQAQLDAGFIDAFRKLHPEAKGHYSYWSTRAGNRGENKGLRLDYFCCSPELFDESSRVVIRDCYMVQDQDGSDHCPIVLEMEIKK